MCYRFDEDAYRDNQLHRYLDNCDDEDVSDCCGAMVTEQGICDKCLEHCSIVSQQERDFQYHQSMLEDKADEENDRRRDEE